MITLLLFRLVLSAAAAVPWMVGLAIRIAARLLNMPEPLLHHTGALVWARAQAIEHGFGQLLRQLPNRRR